MSGKKESPLKTKSFHSAIRITRLYKYISDHKKGYVLNKQLLRGGTAVGALIREAQNAESKQDFIHKMGIAQKECDETIYWLELLKETDFISKEEYSSISNDAIELLKMNRSSIITAKANIRS